jgi:hypothetical protein
MIGSGGPGVRLACLVEAPAQDRRALARQVHLPATAIEEGRDPSSMSGIQADSAYRPLPA